MTSPTAAAGFDDRLAAHRLVPVVVLDDPDHAAGLGRALVTGGLPVAEVTLRTPAALASIERLARDPQLLVGAGTVTRAEQVDRAIDAGAGFVVCPGLSASVVRRARELGVPCVPGVATPTELMAAVELGCASLKLFPAAELGGPAMVRALAGPFPDVRFVPTGGIGPAEATAYLALPSVLAVGGSWMVPRAALAAGRFDEVTRLVARAVAAVTADPDREEPAP